MAAFLFFAASWGVKLNFAINLNDLLKIILILLAVWMVFITIRDKNERKIQVYRKEKLKYILNKQKKVLKSHFDLQKKLNTSLNFAKCLEETIKNEEERAIIDRQNELNLGHKDTEHKINSLKNPAEFSQTNMAKSIVEGEDISTFPIEWQQYFVNNEGKPVPEKLNKMFDLNNNDSPKE